MFLGSHMSIAGGLDKAVERIRSVDGTALQIFSRNQRQWKIPPLSDEDVSAFRRAVDEWGSHPVAVHDSYLINMASPEEAKRKRALETFAEEIRRCSRLGVGLLVTHPGSHLGAGIEQGMSTYVQALDQAIAEADCPEVKVLLETTAGQGTNLGSSFEELAQIISRSSFEKRLGVCLDSCHAFAAGYCFAPQEDYDRTMDELERTVGAKRVLLWHLNDSKTKLGSRKDRHEHIGRGEIGLDGFANIINDPRFASVPFILETDKDDKTLQEDRENMRTLRSLLRTGE